MENYHLEREHNGNTALGFLGGLLLGGLAGAVTMLLMAPQSGERTRSQIRRKGVELREQANETIEDTLEQARDTSRQISAGVQKQADKIQRQADKIQQRGQEILDEQKERWLPVVEAGQKATKSASN